MPTKTRTIRLLDVLQWSTKLELNGKVIGKFERIKLGQLKLKKNKSKYIPSMDWESYR